MIFSRAYYGPVLVRRIFCNGKLLWNYGADTCGLLRIYLHAQPIPETDAIRSFLFECLSTGQQQTAPRSQRSLNHLGILSIRIHGVGFGRHAQTVTSTGSLCGIVSAFAPGFSYGLIFSRGQSCGLLTLGCRVRTADCQYPEGFLKIRSSGALLPKRQSPLHSITLECSSSSYGTACFTAQEDTGIHGAAQGAINSLASPGSQWAQWLDPVQNSSVLHIRMVNQATQNDRVLSIL